MNWKQKEEYKNELFRRRRCTPVAFRQLEEIPEPLEVHASIAADDAEAALRTAEIYLQHGRTDVVVRVERYLRTGE